jgi:hypothetical protein
MTPIESLRKLPFGTAGEILNQLAADGFAIVPREPTDEMLNAAQSRLCEIENFTNFVDYNQAEMFKAMVTSASEPKRYLTEG